MKSGLTMHTAQAHCAAWAGPPLVGGNPDDALRTPHALTGFTCDQHGDTISTASVTGHSPQTYQVYLNGQALPGSSLDSGVAGATMLPGSLLIGGTGNDLLVGNAGDDTFSGGAESVVSPVTIHASGAPVTTMAHVVRRSRQRLARSHRHGASKRKNLHVDEGSCIRPTGLRIGQSGCMRG